MKKFVDIIPKSPVQLGNHIQRLRSNRVWLDVDDIRTAIVHKATVIEHTVYGDVNLDFSNYDKDLNSTIELKKLEEEKNKSKSSDEYASPKKAVIPENVEDINYDGVSEILEYNAEDLVTVTEVEDIES